MHSFGAHFAEVKADPDLGTIKVDRYVSAFAEGRIPKNLNSQVMGVIVGGIGMALEEEYMFPEGCETLYLLCFLNRTHAIL